MSYAVLFKIYFIDPFVVRQLERLKARIGTGDLYVVIDETKGPVDPIPHDRIIRMTETDMIRRGFVKGDPWVSMFWHSADYSLYPLFEDQPTYDYYVTVEYDAVINDELDALEAAIAAQRIDFAGLRIDQPVSQWGWSKTCDTIYDLAILRPYLNAIAVYSSAGVKLLRERRLELSRLFRDGKITQFPMSEAFIATEMEQHGHRVGNLSDFGNTQRFTWWPPSVEVELDELAHCTFIHPVLAGERCAESLIRYDPLRIFDPGSVEAQRLMRLQPRDYLPKLFPILMNLNREEPIQFAMEHVGVTLFEASGPSPNIARGKPAMQSSVSPASRNRINAHDAAGAVNGLVTGTYGFHTGYDNPPWWMVDLEASHYLTELWIFNRLDAPSQLQHLKILISENGRDWTLCFDHRSDGNFLGAWGRPLMITFQHGERARFVRIELGGPGYLHLDQIKIFGSLATTEGQ